MKSAHAEILSWITAAGMSGQLDAVGNLIGRHSSADQPPPSNTRRDTFMIGSHLDTVVNAGRFDGPLGFLLGLGVVELLQASGIKLPFDLDVVGFSEEEGVRYRFPFIGSRGIIGTFDPADLDRIDDDGIRMGDALQSFGCDVDAIKSASYLAPESPRRLIGFMEAHLEQATALEASNRPVGIVSAIAGQTRASMLLAGVAGHAGTVPHDQRFDSLAAAAQLILRIEELGRNTKGLFATVGKVLALPGLSNVISGETVVSLDLRHASNKVREEALKTVRLMLLELQKERGVVGSVTHADHSPAVPMDPVLKSALYDSINDAVGEASNHAGVAPVWAGPELISGAGHDAMIMAMAVPSCMLFVRCKDGVSHHPDELVTPGDITIALEVMTRAIVRFATAYRPAAD